MSHGGSMWFYQNHKIYSLCLEHCRWSLVKNSGSSCLLSMLNAPCLISNWQSSYQVIQQSSPGNVHSIMTCTTCVKNTCICGNQCHISVTKLQKVCKWSCTVFKKLVCAQTQYSLQEVFQFAAQLYHKHKFGKMWQRSAPFFDAYHMAIQVPLNISSTYNSSYPFERKSVAILLRQCTTGWIAVASENLSPWCSSVFSGWDTHLLSSSSIPTKQWKLNVTN